MMLVLLIFTGVQVVLAQTTVTGVVTSADDGQPIPGAAVQVKGTTVGVTTDVNGRYSLKIPAGGEVLQYSFVGMTTKEVTVGNQSVINVVLETEAMDIEGVVVTALGISREKKALGYAVEEVKADELNQTRSGNLITSLSGKVSGVNITSASGNMGGSSRITIRGVKSVSGNNQPLIVVDGVPMDNSNYNTIDTQRGAGGVDYGNMANDINPDDIESVSVLKGPTAAALYGSRAANGVIVITTKKAKAGKKGLGVEVNSSVSFEQVAVLPKYQNLYGGGYVNTGSGTEDGFILQEINGKEYRIINYDLDESWGPRYNGQEYVSAFDLFDWEANGMVGDVPTSRWLAPKKDVKDFFETGVVFNNNFAITGMNEGSAFRLSYTNYDLTGYMPNSEQKRNSINFNGESQISQWLKGFIGANYVNTYTMGRPETGYDDNNIMQKFNQWGQRQLDMGIMSNYVNPDGTQRVWNRNAWNDPTPAYSDNPYWTRYKNYQDDERNRVFGNIGLLLTPFKGFSVQGKLNLDYYALTEMERNAVGSQAESSYSEANREMMETNSEIMANYKFDPSTDFAITLMVGANKRHREYSRMVANTNGGLIIPGLYKITNSTNKPEIAEYEEAKEIQSLFGSANIGWRGMVYLDLTLRKDWSSTIKSPYTYTYPSASLSFIFSELDALKNNDVLSFGKVRFGISKVGNDTDPYNIDHYYAYLSNFGNLAMYTVPSTLANHDIDPESTSSFEIGTELMFFSNRIGLDFTYYSDATYDQIIPVALDGASGYSYKLVNAGEITNKGVEIGLNLTPIKTKSFSWNISANYSHNTNEVVELAKDLDVYRLTNGPFSVSVNAEVGLPYGSIIGSSYVKDDAGNIIVDTDGYTLTGPVKSIGTVLPDYMMGIWNRFNFKGFELSGLIDIRHGGQLFSTTSMWGRYSGILEESAEELPNGKNIRDAVEDGGGALFEGVYGYVVNNPDGTQRIQYTDADGNDVSEPVQNTTRIDAESWGGWHYSGPAEANIFDADYIKLRELRLSYTIPSKHTGPVQNLTVSAFGRNLAIWGADIKHIDPENTTGSGNIQGIEGGALPSLRYFGFGLNFNF